MFVDLLYLLQLEDYHLFKCLKNIKLKTNIILEVALLLIGIVGYFMHIRFDNQTNDIIFISIIVLLNIYKIHEICIKNNECKVMFKITKRIKRTLFVIITIYILTQTMLYLLNLHFNYFIFNVYLLAVFVVSVLISYPIEKLIYVYYLKKSIKKLSTCKNLKIIAITGSCGKTSTKNILFEMLSTKYNVLKSPASFNTPMGISRTILEHLKPYHEFLILEFGAKRKGEIKYLCKKFKPQYGILTSIDKQHMESFGNIENVLKAKMELQQNLLLPGFMVFNCDNNLVCDVSTEYKNDCACVTTSTDFDLKSCCGIFDGAVRRFYGLSNMMVGDFGSEFTIVDKGKMLEAKLSCKLLGRHNISNILCAYAMAKHFNVDDDMISFALKNMDYVPHRLEKREMGNKIILDNSYNSNPASFLCSLEVLAMFENRRKIVVTPGVVEQGKGAYDENYRIGKAMSDVADEVVIVNEVNQNAIMAGLMDCGFEVDKIKKVKTFSEVDFNVYCNGEVVLIENDLPDNYK